MGGTAARDGDGLGVRSGLLSRSSSAESPHPLAPSTGVSTSRQTRAALRRTLGLRLRLRLDLGLGFGLGRIAITRRSSHGRPAEALTPPDRVP
ncbi:hypothetical protein GCM10010372_21240 [Streptomyces tauricus]|nr:hypothetical protein GCM10010372_21240 [Streptomyces tauricus]